MAAGTDDRAGDALRDAAEIVRRVVATRIRDPQPVEDLTQETLVRVASARQGLARQVRPHVGDLVSKFGGGGGLGGLIG